MEGGENHANGTHRLAAGTYHVAQSTGEPYAAARTRLPLNSPDSDSVPAQRGFQSLAPRRTSVLLAAVAALIACGEPDDQEWRADSEAVSVRDSAGTMIVEVFDSTWTSGTRWRIADTPDLVIGSVEGSEPGTDFSAVDGVVSVGDQIAVLERQSQEVRLFGPGGEFVRRFGGRGSGPTEFRHIGRVAGAPKAHEHRAGVYVGTAGGDAIRVSGYLSRKVVEFPLDGSEPKVSPLPPLEWNGRASRVAGWRRGGEFVMAASSPRSSDWSIDGEVGTVEDRWFLFSSEGDSLAYLGALPSMRVYQRAGGSGPVMFGARAATVVTADALIYGFPQSAFEFRRIPLDPTSGVQASIVRIHIPATPMPPGMEERYVGFEEARARERGVTRGQFDLVRPRFEAMEVADTVPPFRRILVAPDGSVWLNRWPDPGGVPEEQLLRLDTIEAPEWIVVDQSGRWLGTVVMPAGFTPHEVGPDGVLGVRTGELGVPFVARYPIIR